MQTHLVGIAKCLITPAGPRAHDLGPTVEVEGDGCVVISPGAFADVTIQVTRIISPAVRIVKPESDHPGQS